MILLRIWMKSQDDGGSDAHPRLAPSDPESARLFLGTSERSLFACSGSRSPTRGRSHRKIQISQIHSHHNTANERAEPPSRHHRRRFTERICSSIENISHALVEATCFRIRISRVPTDEETDVRSGWIQ